MTSTTDRPSITDDLNEYIRALSRHRVFSADSVGPRFSRRPGQRRRPDARTFVPALSWRARCAVKLITLCWVVTYVLFWVWWWLPEHRNGWVGFAVTTLILVYVSTLPGYFLLTVNRLRRVSPELPIPRLRVAIVVTKAPSEPWPLVRKTLMAMLAQDFPYPYDVWICDENPSPETVEWCRRSGVRVSTRWQVEEYQRTSWPRQRRCKEGNLAYFYDHFGYRNYDVVAQLDADHVPTRTYLAEMVRPFADPAIGYVAAPSVCDRNRSLSWTVRGRLFHEAVFHGPHQLGHNGDLAPISIGSHYAVRTEALASIGGIGPELAEDFSTSYLMYVGGWSGAFAIDAHASGDGPADFSAMITQEFQWSRSLGIVMVNLVPRTIGRLPLRLRLRFAFSLAYYPFLVGTALGGLTLLALASTLGIQWVDVNYPEFLGLWTLMGFWLVLLYMVLRRNRLLRPERAPFFSWEDVLFILTKWPYNAWGLAATVIQIFAPRPMELKVTPKGQGSIPPLPLRSMMPYIAITVTLSLATLAGMTHQGMVGYAGLCLISALSYGVVCVAVPILHGWRAVDNGRDPGRDFLNAVHRSLPVAILALIPLTWAAYNYPAYFIQEVLQ